jgi:hypothetical protein
MVFSSICRLPIVEWRSVIHDQRAEDFQPLRRNGFADSWSLVVINCHS